MMIRIAHRGNQYGPDPINENKPDHIAKALDKGLDAEVDVWCVRGLWYLGHDGPEHKTNVEFLQNPHIWCHAKNIQTLPELLAAKCHCFFHVSDDCVLTSKGFIWTFPGKMLTPQSICVLPEIHNTLVLNCYGVCSDFIERYGK